MRHLRVRSLENVYRVCWHHVRCCGTKLAAEPRVHHEPRVGSTENEWIVVHLGRAFGYALDTGEYIDVSQICVQKRFSMDARDLGHGTTETLLHILPKKPCSSSAYVVDIAS